MNSSKGSSALAAKESISAVAAQLMLYRPQNWEPQSPAHLFNPLFPGPLAPRAPVHRFRAGWFNGRHVEIFHRRVEQAVWPPFWDSGQLFMALASCPLPLAPICTIFEVKVSKTGLASSRFCLHPPTLMVLGRKGSKEEERRTSALRPKDLRLHVCLWDPGRLISWLNIRTPQFPTSRLPVQLMLNRKSLRRPSWTRMP